MTLASLLCLAQTPFDGFPGWYHFSPSTSDIPDYKIASLAVDNNGSLWVGSAQSGGLARYRDDEWKVWHHDNSPLTNNAVGQLIIESEILGDENVWMVPNSGASVIRKNSEGWTKYSTNNSNIQSSYVSLKLGADGKMWVLNQSLGSMQYFIPDSDDWSTPLVMPWGYTSPDNFAVDKSGNMWLSKQPGKLYYRDIVANVIYDMSDTIDGLNGRWYPLMETYGDSLFLSAYGKGSNSSNSDKEFWLYDGQEWLMWARNNSEISGFPYSMDVANGALWLACDWGISKFDGVQFTNWDAFNSPIPLDDKTVTDIVIDKDRRMWVSTSLMGLFMFNINEYESYINSVENRSMEIGEAFPNPTNSFSTLILPHSSDSYKIEVYDITGKCISQLGSPNGGAIQLNFPTGGIYNYRVSVAEEVVKNGSVMSMFD